jgi:rod shape determining protein RodA
MCLGETLFNRRLIFKKFLPFIGLSDYLFIGFLYRAILSFIRLDYLITISHPLYFLSLLGLIVVLFGGGDVIKGAGRWIDLGLFKIQPSEFAKLAYLLAFSYWLSRHPVSFFRLKSFFVPAVLFIIPFILVLQQPDLSTALVFTAITLVGFYWAGLTLVDMFLLLSPLFSVLLSHSQFVFSQIFWGDYLYSCYSLFYRTLPKAFLLGSTSKIFVIMQVLWLGNVKAHHKNV